MHLSNTRLLDYFVLKLSNMEKPFVFVLMPFAKEFDEVFEFGMKAAASEVGMYCERVDKQIFENRIIDQIYNQISKADFIIADLSDKNPNVFYETGYAHALDKKVILVNTTTKDMPFDLHHHPQIIYGGDTSKLKNDLVHRLKWYLQNPSRKAIPNFDFLKFAISGQFIEENKTINISRAYAQKPVSQLNLVIDVWNSSSSIFSETAEIGIQTFGSDFTRKPKDKNSIKIPGSGLFFPGGQLPKLLPEAWTNLEFQLSTPLKDHKNCQLELKIFTELLTIVKPFSLSVKITDIPPPSTVHFSEFKSRID